MIKEIKSKKIHFLSNGEKGKIFGRGCTIACGCTTNCGDYEAFRISKEDSGVTPDPPVD